MQGRGVLPCRRAPDQPGDAEIVEGLDALKAGCKKGSRGAPPRRQKKRRGKLEWVNEPLFPYYLFIRLDRLASNWRPIRSTRGVLKIVTFGLSLPVPVSDALVETLLEHGSGEEDATSNVYFRAGEAVEITEGPFKDLQAVFASHKGEERAIVLLNLLHKQQRLEMPVSQLRRHE